MGGLILGSLMDIDGTVLDTEVLQYNAWVEALKEAGETFTEEEYKRFAGQHHLEIARQLVDERGLDVKAEDLTERKLEILGRMLKTEPLNFMPHAQDAIRYFRRGYFALVTNGSSENTETKLVRSGLEKLVRGRAVVTRDDVEHGKPAPDLYVKGAEVLGLPKQVCVAFEDTEPGIASAAGAGVRPIAIINPRFSSKKAFPEAERNYLSLAQAMSDLKNHYSFKF